MATLAEIRARLSATQQKPKEERQTTFDNTVYPHWNADEGTTASVRFLPDQDPSNPYFWVERQTINLEFVGIKGQPGGRPVTVKVPCVEMYDPKAFCPITSEIRTWYKSEDASLKELANKYWKKRTYIFQGFVRQNPIAEDSTPANPIRRFVISPQIFAIIKASIMDPELEELPTDYNRGLDFNFKKTTKGNYSDYSTSNWARKESALTEAEQAAIKTHNLYNLAEFLPNRPSEAELNIQKEMFEASLNGEEYDTERWGAYYRPYGVAAPKADNTSSAPVRETVTSTMSPAVVAAAKPAPAKELEAWEADVAVAESVVVPTTTAPAHTAVPANEKAASILAMIRNRPQAQ